MQLTSFLPTDKGAEIDFADTSVDEVAYLLGRFMEADGFVLEKGTKQSGTWGSGGKAARFLVGGFAARRLYVTNIIARPSGTHAAVTSAMSGWSGSVVGVMREKQQRREMASRLRDYLSTLPVRVSAVSSGTSAVAELERLADLRARGVLTEDEFAAAKATILQPGMTPKSAAVI